VECAKPGDTITFLPSVNHIILTTGQIFIDKDLTINGGSGDRRVIIDGNENDRIFYLDSNIMFINNL